MRAHALGLALCLALGPPAAVPDAEIEEPRHRGERERAWYLPDQAKLQLAGNIGFLSPGVGWAWRDRRITADAFFGWVPEVYGGDVLSVTGKLTWRPWTLKAGSGFELRPLTAAVQLTYTLGGSFFVDEPSRYPDGYYPFPTALRSGVAFGSAASWPWRRSGTRIGVFYELVALDHVLVAWWQNAGSLSLADVFSLAIGTSVEF